jgi:ABC-2 type transport system permease protein
MASWIYQSTPVLKPGQIISGALKALLIKFFIPVYAILFAFAWYVWGLSIVDDFVFGFFNNILIFLITANLTEHYLPFSRQSNTKQQSGRFAQVIMQMIIIAALVGLHYLVIKIDWLIYCLIPVAAAGCYFLFKRIQELPWLKISF